MEKVALLSLIIEWQKFVSDNFGIVRSYQNDLLGMMGSKPIKIITGFRRSGKSFLVQKTLASLIADQKVDPKNILYLNFEDFRLSSVYDAESLNDVVQLFMNEIAKPGHLILVFDEIQMVQNWDKLIRTLYEKHRNMDIVITGSNSELLSSELGSNLAGRFISLEVLPFDFNEFLRLRDLKISTSIEYLENEAELETLFSEYLQFGGLPETSSIQTASAKQSYLQGVVSKVILDDIVKRFNIRHASAIEQLLRYLFIGIGNIVSLKKIVEHLNASGYEVKYDTVSGFVQNILQTFALFPLEKFDYKQSRVFNTMKKYYTVDHGFSVLHGGYLPLYSKLLENAVFLKLKRSAMPIYYGRHESGKEIDFVVTENHRFMTNYQVSVSLNEGNTDRELASFASIDKYVAQGKHILLTSDRREEILEYAGVKVEKRNIIRWLLDL
jgi:uncharacterized protein